MDLRVKKLVFPIIMALVGVMAVFVVFTNVSATTSTALTSIRVGDGTTFTDVKAGDTYKLPTGTVELTVQAEPVDPAAEVSVTGNTDFKPGNNTLTIVVKGSDGKTSSSYTLTLVQEKLSGWCEANAEKIKLYNDDYELADIYQDISLAYLDERLPEIKENLSCFSDLLQDYVKTLE
jgi:hypothetical protein